MAPKDTQLQIRVTAVQKAELRRRATAAGCDVSTYVLDCALPDVRRRVDAALAALRSADNDDAQRFAFAELADTLAQLGAGRIEHALEHVDVSHVSLFAQNYVAAMVEEACALHRVASPAWTRGVAPLDEPWFATSLRSLRLYLLRVSPLAYKRRNLFVDAGSSARV